MLNGLQRILNHRLFSADENAAPVIGQVSENSLHDFRSPRSHQSGYSQNLTGLYGEIHIVEHPLLCEFLHPEHLAADGAVTFWIPLADFTANHHFDDFIHISFRNLLCAYVCAVPENGDAVAKLKNLLHAVGYIDDGHSLFPQGLHHLKQHLCLALG